MKAHEANKTAREGLNQKEQKEFGYLKYRISKASAGGKYKLLLTTEPSQKVINRLQCDGYRIKKNLYRNELIVTISW